MYANEKISRFNIQTTNEQFLGFAITNDVKQELQKAINTTQTKILNLGFRGFRIRDESGKLYLRIQIHFFSLCVKIKSIWYQNIPDASRIQKFFL